MQQQQQQLLLLLLPTHSEGMASQEVALIQYTARTHLQQQQQMLLLLLLLQAKVL